MREITGIRRVELGFAIGIAVIYVVRRLMEEVGRIDDMVASVLRNSNGQPAWLVLKRLSSYDHTLNNNVPLIGGVLLFLLAWYTFHYLAVPAFTGKEPAEKAGLFAALTLFLLVSSVFFYHIFKRHVEFREYATGKYPVLRIYSVFSKRNVLADSIGLGFLLVGYELMSQLGYYLDRKLKEELRFVRFIYWIPVAAFLLVLALFGHLPRNLWGGGFGSTLLMVATLIELYWLQEFIYTAVLPYGRDRWSPVFVSRVLTYLASWLGFSLVIWGPMTHFTYSSRGINTVLLFLTLFVPGLIALMRRVFSREKIRLQTQVSHTSAELAGLQSQINPHFLFNALNSLYATALQENSEKTADGIQKLGDMMRFMLQENNRDRIPLDKEVEYLRNYIQLQRMRLDESHGIEIRVTIQEPDRAVSIAPMILLPFVENAFKHGISLRNPSWIFVTLTLDLTTIYFKVHNSRHPVSSHDPEKDRAGIGLENVKKRLELIYPERHTLAIQASEQDYFVALTIRY
ncbi:sensor histidine kinase [Larkinella bovis]|uniref:Sensor histidine kinase n=1 Tax=Larkinella bovis TaxID=683041 RepID=A0ABW0IN77_9BACT